MSEAAALSSSAPAVRERGILYSPPMVRAVLADRKTNTRRVCVLRAHDGIQSDHSIWRFCDANQDGTFTWQHRQDIKRVLVERCPYGKPGDRLWVREAWRADQVWDGAKPSEIPPGSALTYEIDGAVRYTDGRLPIWGRYRHARFMPRWASRTDLEVTAVRVQQLQDISEEDAIAEGVDAVSLRDMPRQGTLCRRDDFAQIWNLINGAGAWALNPWVWCVAFRRIG